MQINTKLFAPVLQCRRLASGMGGHD